jgi:hypothetical protein
MPVYVAGSVHGNATVAYGTGFTVARIAGGTFVFAGRYRITIPATPTARFLVTTVTPMGTTAIARITAYSKSDVEQTIDIETRLSAGTPVDADFTFVAVEVQ